MADDELLDIFIPEGVVIDKINALPGAELLTGASSLLWSDAVSSPRRTGSQRVSICRDHKSFLNALGLEQAE